MNIYPLCGTSFYEKYKNPMKPHCFLIHCTSEDIAMEIMCTCPSQHHGLPHCKCVLHCCKKFPSLSIPHMDKNKDATNMCSTINFHVYRNVSRCYIHI